MVLVGSFSSAWCWVHGDCRVVFVSMLVGQGFRWEVGGGSLLIRGGVDEVSSSCSRAAPRTRGISSINLHHHAKALPALYSGVSGVAVHYDLSRLCRLGSWYNPFLAEALASQPPPPPQTKSIQKSSNKPRKALASVSSWRLPTTNWGRALESSGAFGDPEVTRAGTTRHATNIYIYHIISYHIISYHIISYHIISYHTIPYHIISYHIISYHITSHHITSYHIISYHTIPYHIISYHIISYRIISYHIISYHIISYHIISYTTSVPFLGVLPKPSIHKLYFLEPFECFGTCVRPSPRTGRNS